MLNHDSYKLNIFSKPYFITAVKHQHSYIVEEKLHVAVANWLHGRERQAKVSIDFGIAVNSTCLLDALTGYELWTFLRM